MSPDLRLIDAKPQIVWRRPFTIQCPKCDQRFTDSREGLAVRKVCAHIVQAHDPRQSF